MRRRSVSSAKKPLDGIEPGRRGRFGHPWAGVRTDAERAAREAREPRDRHTPQFLQRPTAPQPAGAGAPLDDDDDFED